MSVLGFVAKYRHRFVTAPAGLGGQCVDLANEYLIEERHQPKVWADAAQWRFATIPGMVWVQNTPTNYPSIGSLVVWGMYQPHEIGPAGHIAVVLVADPMELCKFDQNWPEGTPCEMQIHDYGGVLGWHSPA